MHTTDIPVTAPVQSNERIVLLDVIRGIALAGVLLVNAETLFRISIFTHILTFPSNTNWLDRAVDILVAGLFEFKSLAVFAFLFGVGMAIQWERRTNDAMKFLARRMLVLLAIGLCHLLFVWNGDILTLYAICGLLLLPFLKIDFRWQFAIAALVIALSSRLPLFGSLIPKPESMRFHAEQASLVYSTVTISEVHGMRISEAIHFILPLVLSILPLTFGLMLLGTAAWGSGMLRQPDQHRSFLKTVFSVTFAAGILITAANLFFKTAGLQSPVVLEVVNPLPNVALATAYVTGACLWIEPSSSSWPLKSFAALGRMALSNYIAQSIILSLLFYGFGFGLFGKLGSAATAGIVVFILCMQLVASSFWLLKFQFGPVEWLWRSLTYGRLQPFVQRKRPGLSLAD